MQLKQAVSRMITLYTPDIHHPFILCPDASEYAISACLLQMDPDTKVERPIAFVSKKLNGAQCNYSVSEKEALAVVYGLSKFDYIVFSSPITLYTDQNPLVFLAHASAGTSSRLIRWGLGLARYDLTVVGVKGSDNFLADYFSRVGQAV